jgi:hypothetical protein
MKKSISVKGKTHDRLKGFLDGEPMGPWVEKLINDALDAAEEERTRVLPPTFEFAGEFEEGSDKFAGED